MAWIGLVAGAVAGLAPLAVGLTGGVPVAWTFVAIALVELVAFLAFAGGVVGFFGDEKSPRLRRVGYACLLVLVSLPSSLLLLAPFVAIAGISLGAPLANPVGRDTPS